MPGTAVKNGAQGVNAVPSREVENNKETNIQLVIQGASGLGSYQEQSQTQQSQKDAATPLVAKSFEVLREGRSNPRSQAESRADRSKAGQSGVPSPMSGALPPAGYYQSQILDLELNQISDGGYEPHDQTNAVC